jgi:hypothetical protein
MLLELDFGASLFELLLGGFGGVLGDAFEHLGRGAFDELLGVGEAETGSHFAHRLDDGDLVGTAIGDDDVEFGLFFDGFGGGGGPAIMATGAAAETPQVSSSF